ncbi:MAG TPA: class I SAM-dependent methyltransferase [Anaerolineales bacterium]|nr:class I SAM-dependent methyltransferase [Anaerolineales bacterium]
MDSIVGRQLLDLNRRFYTEYGREFSATRGRLQAGVLRVIGSLRGDEAILDLGCGNGELARTLSRRGHHGSYLGLDFSPPLLENAERGPFAFPVHFRQVDLVSSSWDVPADLRDAIPSKLETGAPAAAVRNDRFDMVLSFAVLHHIPGMEMRLAIIQRAHGLLKPGGMFVHSNWQFLNSPRLRARIQSWGGIGLAETDVDANDYLLDWKRGGRGLRYVHHFAPAELAELAKLGGFEIIETFYSDGENERLSLYQVWKKVEGT